MMVVDVESVRALEIDGHSSDTSVFIAGPRGFCIEIERQEFIEAIRLEFGLMPIAFQDLMIPA